MTVTFLGTGSALTSAERTTTMLAFASGETFFLVDCGGDAVQRMQLAGLEPASVAAVVLTHAHPDHIAGFPLLVEKLWLLGRRAPVPVYGLAETLAVARRLFEAFDTSGWEGLPDVEYHAVETAGGAVVLEHGLFRVRAWPVVHPVPTLGLRVETPEAVAAYSCDTAACANVTALARDADLLIHEATGHLPGVHSSAEEAASCAAEAGVRRLVLVHLPPVLPDLAVARATFVETSFADEGGCVTV